MQIEVVPYDPLWTEIFEAEAEKIRQALGANCVEIHHIGSTSVPGLSAKPIIDILPVVRSVVCVDRADSAMESLGYEVKGEHGIAFRRFFQKGKSVNVHVFQEGDPEICRYLKFRDWMREHPEDAASYAALKGKLAKHSPDILHYCNGKDAFVAQIDTKCGYEGWRIVQALTDREWSTVQRLSGSSKSEDAIHLVFYKNSEIIGYVQIKLLSGQRALLRMLIVDEPYRNKGYGSQFLKLCERWLQHRGFRTLTVEASKFFEKRGYERNSHEKIINMNPEDRPKITIYIATSIDGYIARKDGNLDWLNYGHEGDEDYGFKKFTSSIDTLIFGRNTYQVVSGFGDWPYKGKRVIVLSHTLKDVRKEAELYCGSLHDLLAKLHSENSKHVWVDGGITASKFLEEGLVDNLIISTIPMILGSGIPLFSVMDREHKCRLISSQSYPSGLVQTRYEVLVL